MIVFCKQKKNEQEQTIREKKSIQKKVNDTLKPFDRKKNKKTKRIMTK
jgi:hypothetical protein